MRRFVFQPKWVFGHLMAVAAALTCLWLGDWQWTRALTTAEAQNWGYALQWPLFSVCFLVGWWRMLRLESRRLDELDDASAATPAPTVNAPLLAPPTAPAAAARPADSDEDEQHAAYNRMLAALAAQDAAQASAREAEQVQDARRR
ncbi:MAG: hypothetical protein ACT4O0_14800 [Pseudonocardia sp.]